MGINDDIILYALRYSLKRETDAPLKVMDAIIKNIDFISIKNIKKMIEEIEKSEDEGFYFYKDTWEGLVNDLEFELKLRGMKN